MVNVNITLFVQMINFLLLLWILNLVLFRPIRQVIRRRNELITGFNDDINTLSTRAQQAMEQLEEKLRAARAEGVARINRLKEDGQQIRDQLLSETNQEVQERVAAIRQQVQRQIEAARRDLEVQIEAFSVAVVEKILGRSVN